ncbi:MAG: peptidylprolyl isomerase [Chthonomonadales bacterium]
MRAIVIVVLIALAGIALSIAIQPKSKDLTPDPVAREEARRNAMLADTASATAPGHIVPDPFAAPKTGAIRGTLTIEGRGSWPFELYPSAAPKTVAHFVDLVNRKFYDGIKVHRVVPAFVLQMGDPGTRKYPATQIAKMGPDEMTRAGIGSGGSGTTIPFEQNNLNNVYGSIAMALNAPRSATGDSQFFINLNNNHNLDRDYCVFGRVLDGLDRLSTVRVGDTIQSIVINR